GARVEVAPYKRDPMDFVLWKPSSEDQPGWESPWGYGRPGWHIECSAMSYELLGARFDIHGGGKDLEFPHHENEIAQSCCAHPAPAGEECFASYWLHNEMLQVEGKKMSKSLGNFFTVHDLLEEGVPGEVIRFVFLQTHYRKPMDWTERKAELAQDELESWYFLAEKSSRSIAVPPEVIGAVADDLNTAQTITEMRKFARQALYDELKASLAFLGLMNGDEMPSWARKNVELIKRISRGHLLVKMTARMTKLRKTAMDTKDFSAVDAMKSALLAAGVEVRMSKDGVELVPGADFDPDKLEGL
ncbi:MAG TPA: cysteine--tRNA ligase, partial [Aliiroseovarius sp.]|nr:cysteine--tRNA ligase [Aliiroseovarius sp.]